MVQAHPGAIIFSWYIPVLTGCGIVWERLPRKCSQADCKSRSSATQHRRRDQDLAASRNGPRKVNGCNHRSVWDRLQGLWHPGLYLARKFSSLGLDLEFSEKFTAFRESIYSSAGTISTGIILLAVLRY
uniref:Secreted protein n=1 Tax=Steinernema glaseri TaxID=37863 RepID=A0A1I7ZP87_9BILA